MCLNQRYDEDPPWGDEKGFMWSPWLLHRYFELNDIDDITESQNEEIDMIYNAAKQGRSALEAVEKKLRNKK